MATGGSGDSLTGLITALACQGLEPYDAARLGVYLHGLAGDLAAKDLGETSLIARDIISYLPKAMKEHHKR
jgi:NAD(P)H-hydrate epimerase